MATYKVIRTEEYYGPKIVKKVALSNEDGQPLEGLSHAEAKQIAAKYNAASRFCGHNMSSPPRYSVSQEK